MPKSLRSKQYNAGRIAALRGMDHSDNPYHDYEECFSHAQWREGWRSIAYAAARRLIKAQAAQHAAQ